MNIRVDTSTQKISLVDMAISAMPDMRRDSAYQKSKSILDKYDGGQKHSKMKINGKGNKTIVASLESCMHVLDNMPGEKWVIWRRTSSEEFKRSFRAHVESILGQQIRAQVQGALHDLCGRVELQVQQEDVQDVQENEIQGVQESGVNQNVQENVNVQSEIIIEAKSAIMQKSLQEAGFTGSVRVDESSGKASVIDVIRLLDPGIGPNHAGEQLRTLLSNDSISRSASEVDLVDLASRVDYLKINDSGRTTPVADAKTIVEIIWLLPSKAAKEFRRKSAETIARVLGGDTKLCEEIEYRHYRLQSTEQGRAFSAFMNGGTTSTNEAPPKKVRYGPEFMEHALESEYQGYISTLVRAKMAKIEAESKEIIVTSELKIAKDCFTVLESIAPLDGSDKIEFRDSIKDIIGRSSRFSDVSSDVSSKESALAICEDKEKDWTGVPPPKRPRSVRGHEISIAIVSSEMKIRTGNSSPQIGKRLKRLYAQRYGEEAADNLPKRHSKYNGKPVLENVYFECDKDLIKTAIKEIMEKLNGD